MCKFIIKNVFSGVQFYLKYSFNFPDDAIWIYTGVLNFWFFDLINKIKQWINFSLFKKKVFTSQTPDFTIYIISQTVFGRVFNHCFYVNNDFQKSYSWNLKYILLVTCLCFICLYSRGGFRNDFLIHQNLN